MSRPERIAEQIKREISQILREKVSDPRIGFVSITTVELTPDLKNAKVFVSILGDEKEKKESLDGLKSATHFIRGELGKIMELRYMPELYFVYDNSIERGSRVLSIMTKLERDKLEGTLPKRNSKKKAKE